MRRIQLLPLIALLVCSLATPSAAQRRQELDIRYVFWSPAKYTYEGVDHGPVMGMLSTSFKTEFLHYFSVQAEEYRLVKRARTKYNLGNWLMAAPAGICLGIAVTTKSDATPYIIAGSLLLVGDIAIGVSAYHDLREAADLRNQRVMPTVAIRF